MTIYHMLMTKYQRLLTNDYQSSTSVENVRQITPFYAKQSQLTKCPNRRKLIYNNELCKYYQSDESQKQTQTNPI